jgi:hypothetical protein
VTWPTCLPSWLDRWEDRAWKTSDDSSAAYIGVRWFDDSSNLCLDDACVSNLTQWSYAVDNGQIWCSQHNRTKHRLWMGCECAWVRGVSDVKCEWECVRVKVQGLPKPGRRTSQGWTKTKRTERDEKIMGKGKRLFYSPTLSRITTANNNHCINL